MTLIKIFPDAQDTIDLLTDDEAGRLLKALLGYVNGDDPELSGRELLVYTMFRAQIDRDAANEDSFRRSQQEKGKKGGRPRKNPDEKPGKPAAFCDETEKPRVFCENPEKPEHDYDLEQDLEQEQEVDVDVEHDRAREISAADDTVEKYAVDNLGYMSPTALEECAGYIEDLGADIVKYAIDKACDANKRTWGYCKAILSRYMQAGYKTIGEIRAADAEREQRKAAGESRGSPNPALQYTQRSKQYESKVVNLEEWE